MLERDDENRRDGSSRWDNVVRLVIALIGAVATITAAWIASHGGFGGTTPTIIQTTSASPPIHAPTTIQPPTLIPQSPNIKITYPPANANALVKIREFVRGTWQAIPQGQVIWIVIYPQTAGHFFPQDAPADLEVSGNWTSLAIIGVESDVNEKFDIIAVLADKQAQDAFDVYLLEAKGKTDYPGLEKLPAGAVIYDRVTVTRQ